MIDFRVDRLLVFSHSPLPLTQNIIDFTQKYVGPSFYPTWA